MNIHNILKIFQVRFRKKRMAVFLRLFEPQKETKILDVGGGMLNWQLIDYKGSVDILNLSFPDDYGENYENFNFIEGNALKLDYPDGSIDIVYSNSVIEHVGSFEDQRLFAKEVMRVGQKIYIQTPNKNFLIEPHYLTPFVHFFSRAWQKKILKYSIWGLITRPDKQYVDKIVDEIRLLNLKELKELFPGCRIIREKFFIFTKSYIVVKT